jgi:hypothetical protein
VTQFRETLTSFFDAEKGEDDIRIVFNGTASGLNEVLSAPWVFLPSTSTMTLTMDVNYGVGDNDLGEMLYNSGYTSTYCRYAVWALLSCSPRN